MGYDCDDMLSCFSMRTCFLTASPPPTHQAPCREPQSSPGTVAVRHVDTQATVCTGEGGRGDLPERQQHSPLVPVAGNKPATSRCW